MLDKDGPLKVFPVPGNFGALWYTTWQLRYESNSNDLSVKIGVNI